ncbi:MAG: transporter substrate-binding domain-containing protein [Fermentimonas sp.]|jgi:membrane-bound lytic murein transglycosylase F
MELNFVKRLVIYIILLIIAIATMVMIKNNMNKSDKVLLDRDYQEIFSTGELNVVTGYDNIGYYVMGDTLAGFNYELLKKLEKDWHIDVNIFIDNSLNKSIKGLESQKYDIIARNIPINSDLVELLQFTESLSYDKVVLVQRKAEYNNGKEPVRQHIDLARKKIYIPYDSPAKMRIDNLSHEIGDTIYVVEDPVYSEEQLMMMVADGDIDFTVCSEKMIKKMSRDFPELDVETDISFTQIESWAVRKTSPELLDSLNTWLRHLKSSGEFDDIYEKYLVTNVDVR